MAASIGYRGERTAENPAAQSKTDALIALAKRREPEARGVASGPLQTGEQVTTHGLAGNRVIVGLFVEAKRTRGIVFESATQRAVIVPLQCITRLS
jgi:hypothetical protein